MEPTSAPASVPPLGLVALDRAQLECQACHLGPVALGVAYVAPWHAHTQPAPMGLVGDRNYLGKQSKSRALLSAVGSDGRAGPIPKIQILRLT